MNMLWTLDQDWLFDPNPARRYVARGLYSEVEDLPILGPHGHVPPALLVDPDATLGTSAELFIIPDHYVFWMLYSQGVPMEDLGVPTVNGTLVEEDHRRVRQRFCENFHLSRHPHRTLALLRANRRLRRRGETRRGERAEDLRPPPGKAGGPRVHAALALRRLRRRGLVYDGHPGASRGAASGRLGRQGASHFQARRRARPLHGRLAPQHRPPLAGLRHRRRRLWLLPRCPAGAAFVLQGDGRPRHGPQRDALHRAPAGSEVEGIFARALGGRAGGEDAARFTAHMLLEMAHMNVEDGLAMQLHAGSLRNHNTAVHGRFGLDAGADIPIAADWTRGLQAILDERGNDPRFRLIIFGLEGAAYSRELALLA